MEIYYFPNEMIIILKFSHSIQILCTVQLNYFILLRDIKKLIMKRINMIHIFKCIL
jgi:hypothetical protein